MHEQNILHLDLKPENVLCITPNSNEIKIIDFGLARQFDPSVSTKVSTMHDLSIDTNVISTKPMSETKSIVGAFICVDASLLQ